MDLLTPCLIFGKIVTNFEIENWRSWLPVFGFTYCKVSFYSSERHDWHRLWLCTFIRISGKSAIRKTSNGRPHGLRSHWLHPTHLGCHSAGHFGRARRLQRLPVNFEPRQMPIRPGPKLYSFSLGSDSNNAMVYWLLNAHCRSRA